MSSNNDTDKIPNVVQLFNFPYSPFHLRAYSTAQIRFWTKVRNHNNANSGKRRIPVKDKNARDLLLSNVISTNIQLLSEPDCTYKILSNF